MESKMIRALMVLIAVTASVFAEGSREVPHAKIDTTSEQVNPTAGVKNVNLFDLTGKTALVTGASSGIGENTARCLSQAGARVILVARRLDKLQSLANELGNALAIQMDVADKKSVDLAFKEIERSGEKIDICINNAGIFKPTPVFEEEHTTAFEDVFQTNTMGVWYVTKYVANHMKKHQIQGAIINIGSVNGANYLHSMRSAYCASKAAVAHMTKALVGELSTQRIRINCIIPGPFHTPATEYKIKTPELKKKLIEQIPVGYFAKPNDLDGAILYLASNKASAYVTGSCLTVDGGVSWGGKMVK